MTKPKRLLLVIFLIAVILRTIFLTDSTYFGFDEARDAYISQQIYTDPAVKR